MAVALESVVKQLTDSGIITQGQLKNFIPPKANPKTVEELVAHLVKVKQLTKFQAAQVAAGKAKALILGEYTILDRIGAGGMGQVFKALHRRMERTVAIKMLPPTMTRDPAALARFQREVIAAAKLMHPNIVAALDAGQAGTAHFLVMEFIEGQDLSARVKKHGPLPIEQSVDYILQAARGLEFAHKKGVIHRDIKPSNLLVDPEGAVKILDMGLARLSAAGNDPHQAELTGTGAVMGTVDYMAPEQARSTRSVDLRADIYSLGCTLYYLLTGRPLFDGDTMTAKLLAHQCDPIPRLSDARSDVPAQLDAVLERMVAKTPESRYQTMSEAITALSLVSGEGNGAATAFLPSPLVGKGHGVRGQNLRSGGRTAPSSTVSMESKRKSKASRRADTQKHLLFGGGVLAAALLVAIIVVSMGKKNLAPADSNPAPSAAKDTSPVTENSPAQRGGPAVGNSQDASAFASSTAPQAKPPSPLPQPVVTASKKGNVALRFNSFDDKLDTTAVVLAGRKTWTVEAWVTPHEPLLTQREAALVFMIDPVWVALRGHSSKSAQWAAGGPTSRPGSSRFTELTSRAGERVHLALVRNPSAEVTFFFNGEPQGSGLPIVFLAGKSRLMVHPKGSGSGDVPFRGDYHGLRVSSTERYSGSFTPDRQFAMDADTLVLYKFDEGQGDTIHDASGHGYDVRIEGAEWVQVE